MPPKRLGPRLLSWASQIDEVTLEQAQKLARLPIIAGHVALMPDAHLGKGATVGSVVPTEGAVIPSAVGVDIGCGMIAARTDLVAATLPDDLEGLLIRLERAVPAGVGKQHRAPSDEARAWLRGHPPSTPLSSKEEARVLAQLGTLGSGNHFLEVDLDEADRVWVVLHSGSRGIGYALADRHIRTAKNLARAQGIRLEDPDMAYLQETTPEFDRYIADMLWAQEYAMANRDRMMTAALGELFPYVGRDHEVERINCHHNFSALERHGGRDVWVTRKGAIKADRGGLGVIAGSMGTSSFIVRGKGEPQSYQSCAHGAGRRLSRTKARKLHTATDIRAAMGDVVWLKHHAEALLDEIPAAYKDIGVVMDDQRDLVEVLHELRPLVNYKGVA